ncbi:hypothetical protein CLG96_00325 [Sphingomonas oleivorans]|uniref:Uncharacterized protein n=1 Tax=Sphingomonas oleivorans TaxID=1735121 RepID=A0A2T5G0I7_9SPHN|nr:hypothetical protein [Sphingomonas oleivorans]PTQ12654.1 hypothetical protein CLG96_00325 [Sphingomonas oleivorans]
MPSKTLFSVDYIRRQEHRPEDGTEARDQEQGWNSANIDLNFIRSDSAFPAALVPTRPADIGTTNELVSANIPIHGMRLRWAMACLQLIIATI